MYVDDLNEPNHDATCRNDVNGFYGPGAMLGWYLTLAGCMVSWTLHPERKKRDSISADMLTFLMLPLTAAAHAVSLSCGINDTYVTVQVDTEAALRDALNREFTSICSCRRRYAIEAPAKVIFAYLNIAAVFLYPLPASHHLKRGSAIVIVALLCLASTCYMHDYALSNATGLTLPSAFLSRRYLLAPICDTLVGLDIVDLIWWRFSSRRPKKHEQLENQTTPATQMAREDEAERKPLWAPRLAMVGWAMIGYILRDTRMSWVATPSVRFWTVDWFAFLFPENPYSLREIEQATAAASGALLLAFNLYSAGAAWYRLRQERIAEERKKQDSIARQQERKWHGHEQDQAGKAE